MAEQFEFRDLSDAVFWGVDLQRATFRDVDLMGARISHARLADVVIDAEIDRLIINGVDVTAYINDRDDWFALRSQLHPTEPEKMRQGCQAFVTAWGSAIERARSLPEEQRFASLGGEWSFVETIRHLVFATDKWFTVPILGGVFHPIGLPNSGSADFGWPGIDDVAAPTFEDAAAAWQERWGLLGEYLVDIEPAQLEVDVAVLENGATAVHDCIGIVFEEHFQHLRYATRDLDHLGQ
jgi:hypothetical protein